MRMKFSVVANGPGAHLPVVESQSQTPPFGDEVGVLTCDGKT
jgi:hypothetical protein